MSDGQAEKQQAVTLRELCSRVVEAQHGPALIAALRALDDFLEGMKEAETSTARSSTQDEFQDDGAAI